MTAGELRFEPPLDLAASFARFGRDGDDGLDRLLEGVLVRTVLVDGERVAVALEPRGSSGDPRVEVRYDGGPAAGVFDRVCETVVTAHAAVADLVSRDRQVGVALREAPPLAAVLDPDPFRALVRSICAQQVSLVSACAVRGRLARRLGSKHAVAGRVVLALEPERVAAASADDLAHSGLTRARGLALQALAQAICAGALDLAALRAASDGEVIETLCAQRGIGRWTAEWFLARALGRPRVVAGDLAVRKAVSVAYGSAVVLGEEEVRRRTAHWGPAALVVQERLLAAYGRARLARVSGPATSPGRP